MGVPRSCGGYRDWRNTTDVRYRTFRQFPLPPRLLVMADGKNHRKLGYKPRKARPRKG